MSIQVDTRSLEATENKSAGGESGSDPGPYDSFEILNPQPNQTVRDAAGRIALSLLIEPPLSTDHRLQILVNGQPVPGNNRLPQVTIRGLAFGSNRVQARIHDDLDETIASSAVVDFHLRKPLPEEPRP